MKEFIECVEDLLGCREKWGNEGTRIPVQSEENNATYQDENSEEYDGGENEMTENYDGQFEALEAYGEENFEFNDDTVLNAAVGLTQDSDEAYRLVAASHALERHMMGEDVDGDLLAQAGVYAATSGYDVGAFKFDHFVDMSDLEDAGQEVERRVSEVKDETERYLRQSGIMQTQITELSGKLEETLDYAEGVTSAVTDLPDADRMRRANDAADRAIGRGRTAEQNVDQTARDIASMLSDDDEE